VLAPLGDDALAAGYLAFILSNLTALSPIYTVFISISSIFAPLLHPLLFSLSLSIFSHEVVSSIDYCIDDVPQKKGKYNTK
jgi:hypothetical protein